LCRRRAAIVSAAVTNVAAATFGLFIIIIFVVFRRLATQEASCYQVFLGRCVIDFFLRGGEVPLPGHVVIAIFIFQFVVEEELEVLAIGQGFIIL
jgi:hypothetical protein